MLKSKLYGFAAICLSLMSGQAISAMPSPVAATFTATVTDVTCQMSIADGSGNSSETSLTLPIGSGGQVQAEQIAAGGSAVSTSFKLLAKNCSQALKDITTTLTTTAVSGSTVMIANTATDAPASGVALSLATQANSTSPLTLNSALNTGTLGWAIATGDTSASAEADLVATLVETQSGAATAGAFQALVTFNFLYE